MVKDDSLDIANVDSLHNFHLLKRIANELTVLIN